MVKKSKKLLRNVLLIFAGLAIVPITACSNIGSSSSNNAVSSISSDNTNSQSTKLDYDMSNVKFEDSTITYDGEEHSLSITGTLPEGVIVTYINNGKVNAGTYEVVAHFEDTTGNYVAPKDMKATLKINKATYDMSGVTFSDETYEFDENEHELKIKGELPQGVSVSYTTNKLTYIGSIEVTATFTGDVDNYELIPNKKATLTVYNSGLYFKLKEDGTYEVYGYSGYDFSVIIPKYYQGVEVTSIGSYAFIYKSQLFNIILPSSLRYIEDGSFEYCSSLIEILNYSSINITTGDSGNGGIGYHARNVIKDPLDSKLDIKDGFFIYDETELISYVGREEEVVIPESITSITENCFENHNEIRNIIIPNSVTYIGSGAFVNCDNLTSIVIPSSVTDIESEAFFGCIRLVEVVNNSSLNMEAGSNSYGGVARYALQVITNESESKLQTIDGLIIYDKTIVVRYIGSESDVVIPEGITSIEYMAFRECDSLINVTIPEGVKTIGESAFYFCKNLENVAIPNSVTSIEEYAFYNTGLRTITLPINIKTIENNTFRGCDDLLSIVIPEGVTAIKKNAFSYCSILASVTIPKSLKTIEDEAFSFCDKLVEIVNHSTLSLSRFSSSYGGIAYNAYQVITDESDSKLEITEDFVIYDSYLLKYIGNDRKVTVPNSITNITSYAFVGGVKVTEVILQEGVEVIGSNAFSSCSALTNITIPSTVRNINDYAFVYLSNTLNINYEGTIEEWNNLTKNTTFNVEVIVQCSDGIKK